MAKNITLADIRNAADEKYGHTEIDLGDGVVVTLRNPLRLPKEKRDVLIGASDRLKEDGADQFTEIAASLRAAADTEKNADALVEAFDGDLAVALETLSSYLEVTQAGEA